MCAHIFFLGFAITFVLRFLRSLEFAATLDVTPSLHRLEGDLSESTPAVEFRQLRHAAYTHAAVQMPP